MKLINYVVVMLLCFSAGCQDSRVPALEQRVKELETRVHQLETEQTKKADDDAARRAKLESCIADADREFKLSVARNGENLRDGTYNVPVPLAEQMQRQKQSKIEECRILYSK